MNPDSQLVERSSAAHHPPAQTTVVVSGPFDDLRSHHVRLLQEAARHGPVTVLLWSDDAILRSQGHPPKFPLPERLYLLRALRFVNQVRCTDEPAHLDPSLLPPGPVLWVVPPFPDPHPEPPRQTDLQTLTLAPADLAGFPLPDPLPPDPGRKKVVVTGCYDWLHSGHVRFFEECSSLGNLYVVVGNDANVRALKGPGHPMQSQDERRYMVAAIRYVTGTFISSGQGWLDADPEIRRLRPDIYAVNEDGDKGGKREYCAQLGLEYVVLKRTPAPGLPARSSTQLRGF